jgi:site-specific DNA recombinase
VTPRRRPRAKSPATVSEVRAVIYARVSSAQQVEKDLTEEGYSLPAQQEACARFIDAKGWELAEVYVDAAESARSADRPALKRMLAEIKVDPAIKYVVVHKVDRIARNLEDHAMIRAALRSSGARLVSATEANEDTPSGQMLEGILAVMTSTTRRTSPKRSRRECIRRSRWAAGRDAPRSATSISG